MREPLLLVGVCLLLVVPLLAAEEETHIGPSNFLERLFSRRRECSRRGLCPYVKRLIPHTSGYFVDSGHLAGPGQYQEPPSLCGNLCANDHACPGYQKCCPTNCGYACFDPVFIVEH